MPDLAGRFARAKQRRQRRSVFGADGTAIPIEYRAAPILRGGELQGAICSFVDITARKWFEGRQALLLRLAALQRETDDPATMMRAAWKPSVGISASTAPASSI